MKFIESGLDERTPDAVWTSSPLKKIWLSRVMGYTVERSFLEPAPGAFGRVTYKRRWMLKRNGQK